MKEAIYINVDIFGLLVACVIAIALLLSLLSLLPPAPLFFVCKSTCGCPSVIGAEDACTPFVC